MKRGVSQIDWIVSLAMFILYIGWFFAFLMPSIDTENIKDTTTSDLKTAFKNEFNREIISYPVFLSSNLTGLRPVVKKYPYGSLNFDEDVPFILYNDYLLMLANFTSGTSIYQIYYGIEHENDFYLGLDASEQRVSTENLSIWFDQSLPERVDYLDEIKIRDLHYEVNGLEFPVSEYNYTDHGFCAGYSSGSGNINHTTFLFSKSQELHSLITNVESNFTMKISGGLFHYDNFYSNNLYYGPFNYGNESVLINYSHSKATLYDSESALTFIFPEAVEFRFTNFNDTLDFEINTHITKDYHYVIWFHKDNFTYVPDFGNSIKFGVPDKITGIDVGSIRANYSELKEDWGILQDFQILIYGNASANRGSPILTIGEFSPGRKRVTAETEDIFAVLDNGDVSPISVNYRTW